MKRFFTILAACGAMFSACCSGNDVLDVIPEPAKVCIKSDKTIDLAGAAVSIDEAFAAGAQNYIKGFEAKVPAADGNSAAIAFVYDSNLGKEAYTIKADAKGVTVKASALNGVIYAIQTIYQLGWNIPYMTIKDEPRFAYRGMHLDPCRHFWSIEETKRYIDIMEMHKLNTLHWHLTEDQGWRVEIKKYPRLTEVGAWRAQTIIGHTTEYDGTPYGGFYTQDEIREVVAYAAARGITIIPEVDLPGHMQAAVAAYPELGCTGGPYKVWERWGVSEDVLCVGKEEVFTFLEDVISELCDLFPGEYFHIGGDECPKVRWHECPACKAKMQELGFEDDGKYSAEDYLQSYVTKRMEDFLATKGRKIIGWDEILQGEVSPNATVMSWRGVLGGIRASEMGHDVIMTPNTYCYFDYCQSENRNTEPISIGGYLPIFKVYSFEPCQDMTPEQASHIIGVQANMWTEYISEPWHLEYMLLPRIAALCEVQWCDPDRKDWNRFKHGVFNLCEIYKQRGYTYAEHIFVPGYGNMPERRTTDNLAKGKKAESFTDPSPSYALHCPAELFDGYLGEPEFGCGYWTGWNGEPMDVTVKMGSTKFSSVTVSTLVDKPSYILNLTWCRISASQDGENFTVLAEENYPEDVADTPDGLRNYTIALPEGTKAKYLKIEGGTSAGLPAWHTGAGAVPFLFVDEIIIK